MVSSRALEAEQEDNRRAILGPCSEFFFYANYEQCVTMYTRSTMQCPRDRYAVYFLRDLQDPQDFILSRTMQYMGRWTMAGWS